MKRILILLIVLISSSILSAQAKTDTSGINGFRRFYDKNKQVSRVGYYKNNHLQTGIKYTRDSLGILNNIIMVDEVSQQSDTLFDKISYEKEKIDLQNQAKKSEQLITNQKATIIKKDYQLTITTSLIVAIVLLLLIIFRKFKQANRQKIRIENQKHIVDIKNKEITESITYAKRIQQAILPPAKLVSQYLDNSFILYKPKDVVAGDFYWMEPTKNGVYFAAADCTGHGVPGAMVSVICVNGLNRSVREFGLTEPGEILDNTRKLVIKEFEKSVEEVKDGMDIALCSLEGNILKYAGANNPLWIIRKGEILETKADKQPIGKYAHESPFVTHCLELQKNDSIYIFSDGYVDQFGGEQGKKFKPKALRELLLHIQDKSMEDQRAIIDVTFEDWRGNNEQIDDVCVIGVKV